MHLYEKILFCRKLFQLQCTLTVATTCYNLLDIKGFSIIQVPVGATILLFFKVFSSNDVAGCFSGDGVCSGLGPPCRLYVGSMAVAMLNEPTSVSLGGSDPLDACLQLHQNPLL